jgi:hypothetical protein
LLTLGRQDVETGQAPEEFFLGLGFSAVESLDITSAEGADIVFDLNAAATPEVLKERCDVLFDGGTLEHVFHLPNALARCADMLKENGWFLHLGPMNNWVDHGFYQFSPTLWFDWFAANGWELVESTMVRTPPTSGRETREWRFSVLPPERLAEAGKLDDAMYMQFLVAKKIRGATSEVIPVQAYYARKHSAAQLRQFEPYAVRNGKPVSRRFKLF